MPESTRENLGKIDRTAEIKTTAVNAKARTVDLAFSSETPVRRFGWFRNDFDEILVHTPQSVRLDRFNNGASVLMHHSTRDIVGVVEQASIDSDRRGRAVVRFGKSERAKEAFNDVQDGILRHISIGYRIHEATLSESDKKGEPDTLRATDWEPVELSFVGVPADPTTQVGRSDSDDGPATLITYRGFEDMPTKRKPEDEPSPSSPSATVVELTGSAADKLRTAERGRIQEIQTIGKSWNHVPDIAAETERAIDENLSVDQFRANIFPVLQGLNPEALAPRLPEDRPRTELGMSDREAQGYSVFKAIRALLCIRGLDKQNDPLKIAPFEIECSNAVAEQMDIEAKGLFVPYDVQQRTAWTTEPNLIQRAHELGLTYRTPPMGVATAGTVAGALKGTELLASSFIEALRPVSVALAAGAVPLPGLVGDVDIPKQTGLSTFTHLAEDADGIDTEVPIGVVPLSPKTISGPVPITRKLLKQSTPSVEQIVRNDLVLGAALIIDVDILRGDGTGGAPVGIFNTAGVNTVVIADVATPIIPTFLEIIAFETAVGEDNALRDGAVYMTTWAVAGNLKGEKKDAGSGEFVWENNQVNGYPAVATSQIELDRNLFGSFSQVLLGMWGVLDINIDVATKAKSGGIVLRAFQDIDVGVRHPEAFAVDV